MPTDPHGQAHTGTYGLFDDPDEIAQTTALEEAHEIHRLEGQIRRQERRDRRFDRKEEKAVRRAAEAKGRKSKSKMACLFDKVFGGGKSFGDVKKQAVVVGRVDSVDNDDDSDEKEMKKTARVERVKRPGYKIVRRPATPEQIYHAEDVEAVDSPWLRECGTVKVKSEGAGGCHLVSKTDIEKSE